MKPPTCFDRLSCCPPRFMNARMTATMRSAMSCAMRWRSSRSSRLPFPWTESHPRLHAAIGFLVDWPPHARAARAVVARAEDLDGSAYQTLTTAADALEAECLSCDAAIGDYGDFPDHAQFAEGLRHKHARKHGYWRLVEQ